MGSSIALFFPMFLLCLTAVSGQSSCSYTFSNNKQYATCLTLPVLSCYLHWNYSAAAGTVDIAFRATNLTVSSTGNWAAWALNPTGSGMVGAQALVAYKNSSGEMTAYTSSVKSFGISTLTESTLSFAVSNLTAESSSNQIIIYATVTLPSNTTTINQVWQFGPLSNGAPAAHLLTTAHQSSFGSINFIATTPTASAPTTSTTTASSPASNTPTASSPTTNTPSGTAPSGAGDNFHLNGKKIFSVIVACFLLSFSV